MAVQILFGIVSFVAVVFACRSHMWRGYTESANRRRKRLAEELETLQQAYNVRGDALKGTTRKLADMSELRDRAVQKIVELQRELSTTRGYADQLGKKGHKLEDSLQEALAANDYQRRKLADFASRIAPLELRLTAAQESLASSVSLVTRIDNVPTGSLKGERFRLQRWSQARRGWVLVRKPKAPLPPPVPGYLPNEAA